MKKQKQKKSKINKVVLTFSILMALIFPLFSVYSKSLLSKVNYEVEEIKVVNQLNLYPSLNMNIL